MTTKTTKTTKPKTVKPAVPADSPVVAKTETYADPGIVLGVKSGVTVTGLRSLAKTDAVAKARLGVGVYRLNRRTGQTFDSIAESLNVSKGYVMARVGLGQAVYTLAAKFPKTTAKDVERYAIAVSLAASYSATKVQMLETVTASDTAGDAIVAAEALAAAKRGERGASARPEGNTPKDDAARMADVAKILGAVVKIADDKRTTAGGASVASVLGSLAVMAERDYGLDSAAIVADSLADLAAIVADDVEEEISA